jgi:hypothetical protein
MLEATVHEVYQQEKGSSTENVVVCVASGNGRWRAYFC